MTTILERLLEWMGALGSSVVLLSATLSQQRRLDLASAFARGLGNSEALLLPEVDYPRVTWVTASASFSPSVGMAKARKQAYL